jgi:thiamine biosynthesis lipoprotein
MKSPSNKISRARPLLGTFVEIGIGAGEPVEAIDAAFDEIALIHRLMSFHEANSDVSRLNRAPIGESVEIDALTYEVLSAAFSFSEDSGGAFDVTVGARLMEAGFLPRFAGVESPDADSCYLDIAMLRNNRVMRRRHAIVDLGGIAKGYAVDRAIGVLQKCGVRDAIVNAGGDLRMFGSPRPVHIRHPEDASKAFFVGMLADVAVATSSGVYAQTNTGRALDPVVDPRQRALRNWNCGITVMAPNCMAADALTKVIRFAPRRAAKMLTRHGGRALAANCRGIRVLRDAAGSPSWPAFVQ